MLFGENFPGITPTIYKEGVASGARLGRGRTSLHTDNRKLCCDTECGFEKSLSSFVWDPLVGKDMPSVMQSIETSTNTRKGVTLYSHPTGNFYFHKGIFMSVC